ncbi:MAG: M23 family metallopeptidase [Vicinamibacterales bacterium]
MKTTLFDTSPLANTDGLSPEKKAERMQVLALVQQFEGMLLTEMLRDVKAEDDPDAESFGLGGSTMTDMMQGEFGQALSRGGGLGLRQLLAESLMQRDGSTADIDPAAMTPTVLPLPGGPAAVRGTVPFAPAAPGDRATDIVAAGVPTTSRFGWRSDPFTGEAKFHRGVDLALAYGSDVKALGPGVVASAGERPGYGLTVTVDHGGGRETLYAHLSSIDVQPGDAVAAGQRIARSGNSGRATGAHLHVEAREFGQPVDVARLGAGWAGRAVDTGVGKSDEIPSSD